MRLRTERKHGLHMWTNDNFIYNTFIHPYERRVLAKDGLGIWERPNTKYPRRLDGPQHHSQKRYPNDQALHP